jgi:hypothetical protein
VFAAGRIRPDGAGFHAGGPIKCRFNTVLASFDDHLGGGITGCEVFGFNLFFLGNDFFWELAFFRLAYTSSRLERLIKKNLG